MSVRLGLDIPRVTGLISVFNDAMRGTPEALPLEERARLALDSLPAWVVRDIGAAAQRLADLANETAAKT
ncbi:hypothetical protein [Actinomadura litoris]|uniref:Uncharacterized protein n=1 Tax=Actinomadura litoris TaxID=2678616 RepID=A0A7K1LAH2_9ACTN|nr:hypothetical protein [Actinomadura litoris]MUN41422.1 hypothetical protein [Actinomadura litoris]